MHAAKGKELGNSGCYTETILTAGDTLTLTSGRDATLLGAQVSGDKVKADIGRNLTLTSQQDNDHYQSKQSSIAAGGSFTFGSMTGSGYINASRQKINSDFESVVEQTGVFAGKQGFDIRVAEHTQLNGAVLAGSADESKNRLSTGTLGWSDLVNRADYKVESQSVGISGSGDSTKGFSSIAAMGSLGGSNSSGSASSTSFASISGGTIDIRDGKAQQQDLVTLHRDPTQAANGLSPIFDKQKELERMHEAQLIGEVGQQATQMVVSHHLDKANQKAKDDPEYANSKEYKALQEKWGIGSNFQRGMQAATAALQGLAGGDLTQAAAGAASPYLAQMVKQQTDDGPSRVMAHALVQGALAAAQNKNAMVGATGAATGELVGMMATQLYHKDASQLTEGEKETVSTLATLAAGLAGGLTGDSTAEVLAGAQTGKTVVENNLLAPSEYNVLSQALDDFDKGKNRLEAAKQIVSLTNKDNVTDGLLYQLQQGKPLSEQDKRILASALDQYGYELQTKYGYTEQQAFAAIEKVKAGEAIVAPAADVATYNKARAYLINYGIQSGQAAVGTDALLALPGNLGTILRSTVAAGGAYQAGTGVGQLIEGQNVDGLINAGLGTAVIFGSVASNKVIGSAGAKTQAATKTINSSADATPPLHLRGVDNSSVVLDKKIHTSIPKVEAELVDNVGGKIFKDTNQGNRPDYFLGDHSRPTLINDRIEAKIEKNPTKRLPNGNMASAHAEVGAIQQAFESGITIGRDMNMRVTKEPICGFCRGDIAAMADKAGLKSLTVYEESTGKTLHWNPGMKSLKEKN